MSERSRENRKLTRQLWLFAAGSFAFGFALVPLYDVICEVTGYGDRSRLVEAATVTEAPDANRTITLEFISTRPTVGAWEFQPVARSMQVQPGKLY
jgi:cytochrome c oxidase assembly protein subunit 11